MVDLDRKDGSISIFNVKGFIRDSKISIKDLPNVILTERPVELQFVSFDQDGYGHRSSFGHHWHLDFDFHVDRNSPFLTGKMHNHDYWEIIVVDSGPLEMQMESTVHELNKGDVCILNRATRHAEHFVAGQAVIYITLSREYINSWPKDANVMFRKPVDALFQNGINLPHYQNKDFILARLRNPDTYSSILNLIQSIRDELINNMPGSRYLVRGLIFRLICFFTSSKYYDVHFHDLQTDNAFSLANLTKQFLDKNKHRITLFELENILQYNGAYINQLFKKEYHCSITEYNQNVCLQHMAHLLLTTNGSVEKICHSIGFVSRTHIYRLFREKYGCSPTDYRKGK